MRTSPRRRSIPSTSTRQAASRWVRARSPIGTKVEVQAVGPLDGNYLSRREFEGHAGVVGPTEALRLTEKGFYSGSISIEGKEKSFFQVSVLATLGGLPTQAEGKSLAPISVGSRVRILDVSESDPYAKDRAITIAREGVVINGPLLPSTRPPWYAGAIKDGDGKYYYFTQVSVLPLSSPAAGSTPPVAPVIPATDPSIAAGVEVRILELGASDPNYTSRAGLIGKSAIVNGSPLYPSGYGGVSASGGSYYTGSLTIDGISYYMSQVALVIVSK